MKKLIIHQNKNASNNGQYEHKYLYLFKNSGYHLSSYWNQIKIQFSYDLHDVICVV